jgi:hypothetical protein
MLQKIYAPSLSFIACLIFLSSCVKGDVISNEEDITGTWAVSGIRSNAANDWDGDGYTETDIYGTYSYCQRDIILIFDPYGTGQGRQGCNSYWQNLNWQLSNNNRTLRIDLLEDVIDLTNLQINYNSIQGEDHVYSNGRNYTITYTLQRR